MIQHINLLEVLPNLPLGYWCERFEATPEELVRAPKSNWADTFHSMWGLAQERQNAPGWGEALFRASLENPKEMRGTGFVRHLDPDLLADGIEATLAERGRDHAVQRHVVDLLMRLRGHASERLTRSILNYYREAVGLDRQDDVFVFSELCRSGHPALYPEFRETFDLLKRTAPFPMEILLSNFGRHYHLATYEMRYRLHALFPEDSTAVGKGRLTNYGP